MDIYYGLLVLALIVLLLIWMMLLSRRRSIRRAEAAKELRKVLDGMDRFAVHGRSDGRFVPGNNHEA